MSPLQIKVIIIFLIISSLWQINLHTVTNKKAGFTWILVSDMWYDKFRPSNSDLSETVAHLAGKTAFIPSLQLQVTAFKEERRCLYVHQINICSGVTVWYKLHDIMHRFWICSLSLCSDSSPGPGRPAVPLVDLVGKLGRWSARCCSHSPRQRWTFQRRSVVKTNLILRDPAIRGHAQNFQVSLLALRTMEPRISRQRSCTAGATGASLPAQPHVLLVRFLKRMLPVKMPWTVYTYCPFLSNCFLSTSSVLCSGKQKAVVRCVNKKLGVEVEDSLCESSRRPPVMIRICHPQPCPPRWVKQFSMLEQRAPYARVLG